MNKQDLAKHIDKINWAAVQADSPAEGAAFEFLFNQVMELDKEDAVRLLFKVIEAQNLPYDFMGDPGVMHRFEFL